MGLLVRSMTVMEVEAIKRLSRSRTEPARMVERARMVWLAEEGKPVTVIAQEVGVCAATVRFWLKRFNTGGLEGLADHPRAGRPPIYTSEEVGEVIAASLTDPKTLGLPFGSWTMDRLQAYLNEQKGIAIKRSRIGEILLAEGLRWRTQETWFGDRVDPDFAAKRGRSRGSIPRRRKRA